MIELCHDIDLFLTPIFLKNVLQSGIFQYTLGEDDRGLGSEPDIIKMTDSGKRIQVFPDDVRIQQEGVSS